MGQGVTSKQLKERMSVYETDGYKDKGLYNTRRQSFALKETSKWQIECQYLLKIYGTVEE